MAKATKPDPSAIAAAMTAPLLMPNGSTLSLGDPLALSSSGLLWMLMPMPSGAEDDRSRDVSPNLRRAPRRTGRVPMRARVPVPMRVCAGGVHSCMRQPATCACACWHAMPLPLLEPSIATLMLGANDRLQNACARPVRATMSASARIARIVAGKRRPLVIVYSFLFSPPLLPTSTTVVHVTKAFELFCVFKAVENCSSAPTLQTLTCNRIPNVVLSAISITSNLTAGSTFWEMEAAREGDLERLRLELPEGADAAQVNRKDEDGRTALHWAAANRPRAVNTHADCVRLLLRRGSKVNTHDDGGWTPIMSACSAGNAEVVRLLIDAQALVDEEEENSQVTPLHLAASKAHLDVVRELLQAGARAQMVDGLGQLPLHRAAAAGHPAIVRLLLGEGSKVNAADKEGVTPLHLAMYEKHREVCVALLEAGASITMKNTQGETPLALAPDDFCALVLNRDADEMET